MTPEQQRIEVFVDTSILARATATQRAEAFLRTLNLWTSYPYV